MSEARGERTKPQNEGGNAAGGGEEGNSLLSLRLPLPLISLSHKLFQFCFCFCFFVFFSHPAPVLESPCNFLGANPNQLTNINETNVKKMKTAMKVHRLSQKEVLK